MKAPDFDYRRPADLDAALALLADEEADAAPLAGGQSLMPMMNFRIAAPGMLVDLNGLGEMRGIALDGDVLRIGAMSRWSELLEDKTLRAAAPLIAMALPHVAHDAIRNRGTIGGSLALADPAAEMPAVMLALGADLEVASEAGRRMIAADDFFEGHYATALEPGELIVAVHVPAAQAGDEFGFHELAQRHGDYALAGVAAARRGGAFRVAFFGIADKAMRIPAIEEALTAGAMAPTDALPHLAGIDIAGDTKASPETRRRLAGVALARATAGMTQGIAA